MTSLEFANLLNDAVMYGADPAGARKDDAMLLESRWSDGKGRMTDLLFVPADDDYEGMRPADRMARDILDRFALADDAGREAAEGIAAEVAHMDATFWVRGISRKMPDGSMWLGKLVGGRQALDDLATFRAKPSRGPRP